MGRRVRLDHLLVRHGLFDSRSKAQAAIMAGDVYVDGTRVDKAGTLFRDEVSIEIKQETLPFVSRGGLKLQHALDSFHIDPTELVCIDVGASTGGFTDCLIQSGARQVTAVDVGYGQLDWTLRQHPKVVAVERTNFRYSQSGDFPSAHLVVIDVSFISLTKILPAVSRHLLPGGDVIALVKPQFEAGRDMVGKGGVIKDPDVHRHVLMSLWQWLTDHGWSVLGLTSSPLRGARGNIEYLIRLRLNDGVIHAQDGENGRLDLEDTIDEVIVLSHKKGTGE